MSEQREREYRVEEEPGGSYRVVNGSDVTVIVSRDRSDAEQYAALLEEAFGRGYRRGYRDAKRAR
jgi:hypothetical protein